MCTVLVHDIYLSFCHKKLALTHHFHFIHRNLVIIKSKHLCEEIYCTNLVWINYQKLIFHHLVRKKITKLCINIYVVLCCVDSLPGTMLAKFGYGLLGSKITHGFQTQCPSKLSEGLRGELSYATVISNAVSPLQATV